MKDFFEGLAMIVVSLLLTSITLIITVVSWAFFAAIVWVVWHLLNGTLPFS
jgi:hypothetical protein